MRAALIDSNNEVVNVISWSPVLNYTPPQGQTLVAIPEGVRVTRGWKHLNNEFIPAPSLVSDRDSIPGDGTTAATVTYTDYFTDATTVTFKVNTITVDRVLADNVASISVVSSNPGDVVVVEVNGFTVEIGVENV